MKEDKFESYNKNPYEGNGWSKYQLMVLQQLNDHNSVLQNLNKEITEFKQLYAVSEAEYRLWRAQTALNAEELSKKVKNILYDEKGLTSRVSKIEREMDVEAQTNLRMKAKWALYGAIVVFIVNIGIKLVDFLILR